MRIDQILPCYAGRDAIGTHARNIQSLLLERGYVSDIFAEAAPGSPLGQIRPYREHRMVDAPEHILVHHFSTGSELPPILLGKRCFGVVDYHNITPPCFFPRPDEQYAREQSRRGRSQIPTVMLKTDHGWADSQYNADQLAALGPPPLEVLPIMRRYEELSRSPVNGKLASLLNDGTRNLLFVGRVAQNKAAHDLLFLLRACHEFIARKVRLVLVGNSTGSYGLEVLPRLARELGLRQTDRYVTREDLGHDVILTGSVPEEDMATFYAAADVFTCFSDHEGCCVPLIEAMFFSKPLLAHRAAAVPETVGDGGLLVDKRDPVAALAALNGLLKCPELAGRMGEAARRRGTTEFAWDRLVARFGGCLDNALTAHQASMPSA